MLEEFLPVVLNPALSGWSGTQSQGLSYSMGFTVDKKSSRFELDLAKNAEVTVSAGFGVTFRTCVGLIGIVEYGITSGNAIRELGVIPASLNLGLESNFRL